MKRILFMFLLGLTLYNCGHTYYGKGWDFIADKDYTGAISYFGDQIKVDPNNYAANFGLGTAYYLSNEFDNAIKYLDKAGNIDPKKSEVKYNLGLCYESKKEYDNALRNYKYYEDKTIDDQYKTDMEKRYIGVLKLKYQAEAKDLIAREKQISEEPSDKTLAVLSFDNKSDAKYDPLKNGFPIMFITDFAVVPGLKVVERLRLQALLDEIKINSKKDLIDEETLQRAGKLLGAKHIIRGGFNISNDNNLSIDIAAIDAATGKVKDADAKSGSLNDFYKIEKDLVLSMLDKLRILMTDDVRRKILTIPTENFFEFLGRMKEESKSEKIELPTAQAAVPTTTQTVEQSPTVSRLKTMDVNTGGEIKATTDRSDVPSRFLPDPPLPPK